MNLTELQLQSGVVAAQSTGVDPGSLDSGTLGLLRGLSQAYVDGTLRYQELLAALSERVDSDIIRRQWLPLEIDSRYLQPAEACQACPAACEAAYGYVHPAPETLIGFSVIQNTILKPERAEIAEVMLLPGYRSPYLHFAHNPLLDTAWLSTTRTQGGKDYRVLLIWLHLAEFTGDYVRRYISPLTQLPASVPATIHQQSLRIRSEPSVFNFLKLLGQISQSPVAEEDAVVTDVRPREGNYGPLVVTTTQTYRASHFCQPIVSTSQRIVAGDRLFDGFEIAELGRHRPGWTPFLRVPGSYLNATDVPFLDLSYDDQVVTVTTSRATFPVGEHSDAYWDYVYGRSADLSAQAYSAVVGRAAINPFEFFRDKKLGYGGIAVRLRGELIEQSADVVRVLHKYLPPHRSLILEIAEPVPKALQDKPPPCCVL